jgi:hypothetical protein
VQVSPKFTQIGIFDLKICHLPTLDERGLTRTFIYFSFQARVNDRDDGDGREVGGFGHQEKVQVPRPNLI